VNNEFRRLIEVKANSKGQSNKITSNAQGLQNKTQTNESVSAQKDGFRYDYNDSSDFKDDKMS
jgi:hypothetical protein